jgi:hypothetical protein
LADVLEISEEVQDALGRSYNMPDVDEDELEAELEALGDEIALDDDTSYLDEAVNAPNAPDKAPSRPQGITNAVSEYMSNDLVLDRNIGIVGIRIILTIGMFFFVFAGWCPCRRVRTASSARNVKELVTLQSVHLQLTFVESIIITYKLQHTGSPIDFVLIPGVIYSLINLS